MQLTKFPVLLVLLTARVCRANIVFETSRPDELPSNFLEDLVNVMTSCHEDRIEGIGIAGNLPDTLIRTLSVRHLIPVVLIGNTYGFGGNRQKVRVQYQHKLNVFIVEASSFNQFDILIQMNVEYSMWWNHMASFFILDTSQECNIIDDYLYVAWQRNILNANALCYRRKSGTIIFKYNPFTNQAPISWQHFKVFPGNYGHPFNVFSRPFRGNMTICTDLNFEKANNFGGYMIRIQGRKRTVTRSKSNRRAYHFWSRSDRIIDSLSTLNLTVQYTGDNESKFRNDVELKKRTEWMAYKWDTDLITYPHETTGVVIISHFRGYKSQLSKIISVIDETSRIGTVIVYFITLIFFMLFLRQSLVPALLNLIRMTCNTSFPNLPGDTASRIYLGCLFIFVVTMQGIYQGQLASLLTSNIPLPNVHTLKDVANYGYKLCAPNGIITLLDDPDLRQKFIANENAVDCFVQVVHDPSTAYVGFLQGSVVDQAQEFGLHIGKEVISVHVGFEIRWNWPLEDRINTMIQRFVEADIIDPWDMKCDPIVLSDFLVDAAVKNNQDFKVMELGELSFAFVILGIGLSCATIVFTIELAIQYRCRCKVWVQKRGAARLVAGHCSTWVQTDFVYCD